MEENKFKKIFSSKLLLFLLLLSFIWLSLQLVRVSWKRRELGKEINNLKSEVERLEKSSSNLSYLIDYFNDPAFLEKEAKEKLNLKEKDENVVMVPEAAIGQQIESRSEAAPPAAAREEKKEESNPVKWWKYFFGK